MKKLIYLLCIGTFVCAKPSYPIHSGVGAIYQGPNSETIIRGPDGSVITSEAAGGAVAVDSHSAIAHVTAVPALGIASVPTPVVAQSAVSHQIIEQSAAAAAASSAAASHTISLSQRPIVVQEQAVAVEPVVVAEPVFVTKGIDTALLDGPSGSIRRHGEDAIISGPASTTIREGNVIASIPKAEVNAVVVEPARTLVAPQAAIVTAPAVESHGTIVAAQLTNVAEANAHLTDINLINEANYAAQVSAANQQQLAAEINAANAASLANEINSQAAVAEANRAALINANAIHSARLAQSQEAISRANLEQQALAQANLEAQLAHTATSQIAQANINAANAAAAAAHSQEALAARAGLEAHLIQSVTPTVAITDVNAINSAALAHSQEAVARANLEAQLVAERNAIASQVAAHNVVAGLNPIITQGNQIISDAIISSTPAPVVEVSPASSIVSSTPGYIIKTSPFQNLIVSSTLKPVSGIIRDRVSVAGNPTAIVGPVETLAGDQVVYQSSSSSSSQAQSHSSSSSQSSSVNVVNSGIGGVAGVIGAPIINTPVGISSTDYSQWQESFSNRAHSAGESRLASKYHRAIIH